MVDQLRFFAGAARVLEGKAAGEYLAGHTSWIRREPIGVVGQVTPWNYPMMMAIWKIAPALAAGNTIVLKPSDTTPETTLLLAELASEFLPAGHVQRRHRRPRHRAGAGRAPDPGPGRHHRLGARRHAGGRERVARPQARAPRARRQGAGHRLRRRRHRGRRRGRSPSPATSTPARTAPRRRGSSPAPASTTTSSPRSPSTPRARPRSACPTTPTRCSARSTTPTSCATSAGFLRPAARPRPRRGRRQPRDRPRRRATSSSPPCVAGLRQDDEAIQNEIFGPVITVQQFTDEAEALALGQRRRSTAWPRQRLDPRLRPGHADVQAPRLRLRLDQHPHPDRRRDAARGLQAQRLRQGPVHVRVRGLHPHQARHGQHRLLTHHPHPPRSRHPPGPRWVGDGPAPHPLEVL